MKKDDIKKDVLEPTEIKFKDKPKEAVKHLMEVQKGQCVNVCKVNGIGYVDLVWGEVQDPIRHTGYGLAHIIDKHGTEINAAGFSVPEFIAFSLKFGVVGIDRGRKTIEAGRAKLVVSSRMYGKTKHWITTGHTK